ncbi:SAM-dependent methyltransferase [Variovorax defluvii]|uniref:SAM-dependent methyltransferase n=1 Tax=Variovorax defluvii TaxID=913761 RepID=A0ABP8IDM2_9BURK
MNMQGYFADLYAASDDPYGVASRWYERRKRRLLMASLPRQRYRRGYEPGCGVGALTVELAARCDQLLASDACERAVALTRQGVIGRANVRVEQHSLPGQWPHYERLFDLVVLSEMSYFLEEEALAEVARCCDRSLDADGTLVACDWRAGFQQRRLGTERAHELLGALGLPLVARYEDEDFVLCIWARDGRSVAEREGIR